MITRPDEYGHNNPDLAIVDSDHVRGGRRAVSGRAELYALTVKADQLKEQVTVVRILSDGENGDDPTEVLLVDDANVGNSAGWMLQVASGGTGGAAYDDTAIKLRVTTIEGVIPTAASPTNKLTTQLDVIYGYVGDPVRRNIAYLPYGTRNTEIVPPELLDQNGVEIASYLPRSNYYGQGFNRNTITHQFNYNTFERATTDNVFGANFSRNYFRDSVYENAFGKGFFGNIAEAGFGSNTTEDDVKYNRFGQNFQYNTVRQGVTNCTFGNNLSYCDIGAGCTNVTVINCQGTAAAPFVIPAGEKDCTYLNNQKVSTATVVPFGPLAAAASYALPVVATTLRAVNVLSGANVTPMFSTQYALAADGLSFSMASGFELDPGEYIEGLACTTGASSGTGGGTTTPPTGGGGNIVAPNDLTVDNNRNASFTPATGKAAADYQYYLVAPPEDLAVDSTRAASFTPTPGSTAADYNYYQN
jgi:hypothetical protein